MIEHSQKINDTRISKRPVIHLE